MRGRKPDITPDPEALTAGTKPPYGLVQMRRKSGKGSFQSFAPARSSPPRRSPG
jgi:hypothetical protein